MSKKEKTTTKRIWMEEWAVATSTGDQGRMDVLVEAWTRLRLRGVAA